MANYSKVILIGKLGKDPKLFSFDKGSMVTSTLAVNRKYKGEFIADWYSLKAFSYAANSLGNAVKGDSLLVEGSIEIENYTDKNNAPAVQVTVNCSRVVNLTLKKNYNQERNNIEHSQNEETDDVPF